MTQACKVPKKFFTKSGSTGFVELLIKIKEWRTFRHKKNKINPTFCYPTFNNIQKT